LSEYSSNILPPWTAISAYRGDIGLFFDGYGAKCSTRRRPVSSVLRDSLKKSAIARIDDTDQAFFATIFPIIVALVRYR
jgi:hypothetical protein